MYWFFFFKQKTAYEMRISDWSSDVCSSDLRNSVGDHSGTTAYNGLPLRWLSKNDGQCVFLKRSHSDAGISRDERRACNWWIARDGATLFLSLCLSWLFTKPAGIDVFVNVRSTMPIEQDWAEPFIETSTSEIGRAQV